MRQFKVTCGDWEDEVNIDSEIFITYESQACEAISRSMERWTCDKTDESLLDPCVCVAHDTENKTAEKDYVISTEHIFANIGRMDLIRALKNHKDKQD